MKQGNDDIFMLWQDTPSVVIGKHQRLRSEVDTEWAEQEQIHIARRFSEYVRASSRCMTDRRDTMAKPLVAIVGRPNVGKSMLFNKLTGKRLSIVEDTPGVTRDRLYAQAEWRGRAFDLVDTGGIEPGTDNQILSFMREQAEIAIASATVIVFVCDIRTGMTAADQEVAGMLQRSGKPVVLAVNKMDSTGHNDPDMYEFYNLGLGDPYPVSAVHGHGTGDLLDACFEFFPPSDGEEEEDDVVKVAIIGKPNVGKSSLVNRILGQERVIVSNVAGTTRDAVDSYLENEWGKFLIIDTAGMRKKSKVDDRVEKFSVLRATMAIERSDVCVIMIDAQEGVTEQDTKVAGLAHEAGKACIIVVNKWDAIEKDGKTMQRMEEDVRRDLSYMTYAPVLFISALTGQRVDRLFGLIDNVVNQAAMRIPTGVLNQVLSDAQARVQPPTDKGKRLKIYYMTQIGVKPPHFVIFCNDAQLFHFSRRRVEQLTADGVIDAVLVKVKGREVRRYDLVPTVEKYVQYLSEKAYGKAGRSEKALGLQEQKLEAEIALKESQGELHRLKTQIAAGEYISIEEVKIDYAKFFLVFNSNFAFE